MKKLTAINFLLAAIFIFTLFENQEANAQGIGIKISPVKIEDIVDPGEKIAKEIKVTNVSNETRTFYVYLRDFKAEGESGQAKLIPPGAETGNFLASWIEATSEGVIFGPNEEKTIPFTIGIPANIEGCSYHGAILMGVLPPKLQLESEEKGAGMAIAQQTASLILLQVRGECREEAQVREFNTDKDFYAAPFNVNFVLRIENNGNADVKPYGTISITNMLGKEVAVLRVNDTGGNVLPGTIRRFEGLRWPGNFGFGRYTANLGLSYGTAVDRGGQGKSSLFAAKTFWIIPWKIIVPAALGLVFISALFFLFLRLYRNQAIKRAMEQAGFGRRRYAKKFEGPSPLLHLSLVLLVVFVLLFLVVIGIFFLFFA